MGAVEKIAATGAGVKNIAIGVAVLAGIAAVAYLGFKLYRGAQAVGEAAGEVVDWGRDVANTDLNPASEENLVNRGVHALLGSDGSWSIGTKIYDWLHPDG